MNSAGFSQEFILFGGQGLAKDEVQALMWFRTAAEQNLPRPNTPWASATTPASVAAMADCIEPAVTASWISEADRKQPLKRAL